MLKYLRPVVTALPFFGGEIGDINSHGEVTFNNTTPCFGPFLGVTDVWPFFISHNHVFSLRGNLGYTHIDPLKNFNKKPRPAV